MDPVLTVFISGVNQLRLHGHPYAMVHEESEENTYDGVLSLVNAGIIVSGAITATALATHIGDDINNRLAIVIADMDFLSIVDDNIFVLIENVHNEISIILNKMQKMNTSLKIKNHICK